MAGAGWFLVRSSAETVNVLAMLVADDAPDVLDHVLTLQVCFLVFAHLLSDRFPQAALMEGVIVPALLRAVEHDQIVVILALLIPIVGVDEAETGLADVLLAYVASSVLEDKSVALALDPGHLELFQLRLGNVGRIGAKVDLCMLVPEDIADQSFDSAELDVFADTQDAINDVLQRQILDHFLDQGDRLDDHVAATVPLAMQLLVLRQAEHHLDDFEPNLVLLVPQYLIRVTLDHLHQYLQNALKELDKLAFLRDE